jgi:hypothetical protein
VYFVNSPDDPYGCDDKPGRALFDRLGGTQIVRNDGHFGDHDQPYDTFPLLEPPHRPGSDSGPGRERCPGQSSRRRKVTSKSVDQVSPSAEASHPPSMVLPSSLKVPPKRWWKSAAGRDSSVQRFPSRAIRYVR